MRSKIFISIITLFVGTLLFGTTYSAWVVDNSTSANNIVNVEVPDWKEQLDWAKYRSDASDEENHLIDNTYFLTGLLKLNYKFEELIKF